MTVRIEHLGPDAWARFRAIRLRALDDAPDAFSSTLARETAMTEATWRARLAREDIQTFLACRADANVGMVAGGRHLQDPTDAGLYGMWVAPAARRSGIAVALVGAVVGWVRARGYPRLRLDVADTNHAAIALYARLGFTPSGLTSVMPPPREHVSEHERVLDLMR